MESERLERVLKVDENVNWVLKKKSGMPKEMQDVIDLAQRLKNESAFQKDPLYIDFKAKNDGQRSEFIKFINKLIITLGFYQECAYWCHKFLDNRVCSKEEKVHIFGALTESYYAVKKFKKAFKYGSEWLKLAPELAVYSNHESRSQKFSVLLAMEDLSRRFRKNEIEEQCLREMLKIIIIRYNKGEETRDKVLESYIELITIQIGNKNSKKALKTFKNIKFFNLYSMNPEDVREALYEEDIIKNFPILHSDWPPYLNPFGKVQIHQALDDMIKEQREIYMELISNDTMKSKSIEAISSCRYVSTMCYLKAEILLQLQEKTTACEWLRVALLLLNNAQLHMKFLNYFGKLVGNPPDISCRSVSTHKLPSFLAVNNSLIRYALMLAEESPSERKQIFILLYIA